MGDVPSTPKRGSDGQVKAESSFSVQSRASGGCKKLLAPLLIFGAFFLNFAMTDVGKTSRMYTTILTPPNYAFAIWAVIYAFEFFFVIYQLFFSKPRNSHLIQNRLSILWLIHQIFILVWLQLFPRQYIIASTCIITVLWLLALSIFVTITRSFRTGNYPKPTITDYVCIEVPFALLFGWETLATIISWNIFFLELFYRGRWSLSQAVVSQVAGLLAAFTIIAVAAVLFAGVPMIMDPVVHLPIVWGLTTLGVKQWTEPGESIGWSNASISGGVAIGAWILSGVVLLLAGVAAVIFTKGKVCLGADPTVTVSDRSSSLSDREDVASNAMSPPSASAKPAMSRELFIESSTGAPGPVLPRTSANEGGHRAPNSQPAHQTHPSSGGHAETAAPPAAVPPAIVTGPPDGRSDAGGTAAAARTNNGSPKTALSSLDLEEVTNIV